MKRSIALAILSAAMAQTPEPVIHHAGTLELHQPVERELAPGETDAFALDLAAGQFVHVVLEKKGVNAVIVVAGPDSKPIRTADSGQSGNERVSLIADRTGQHQLRVVNPSGASSTGSYRIELTDLRAPTDPDRIRIQAEDLLFAAVADSRSEDKQKWRAAIDGYERASTLWRSLHDDSLEALCTYRIGYIYKFMDEYQKSVEFFDRALPLWRAAGDREGEAATLNSMGISYSTLGDQPKALDLYAQALSLWRATGDTANQAKALMNIGFSHVRVGNREKAIEIYNQALPLSRAAGDRVNEAMLLHNIGDTYARLGEPQQALHYYDQALPIWRALGRGSGEASTLYNISGVYLDLGDKQKALETLNRVLPVFRELGSRNSEVLSLLQLGSLHSQMGDKPQALDDFLKALPIVRAIGDRNDEALVLENIGEVYLELSQPRKARDFLVQALAVERANHDRSGEADTLDSLARAQLALGDSRTPLRQYMQALQLARETSSPATQGAILGNLMSYWEGRHNPRLAIMFGKQAVNVYQDLRRNIRTLDPDLQRSYLSTVSKNYHKLADLLIAQGRLTEAEQVLGLLKEQEFFNYIRRDAEEASSVNGRANLTPEEAEAEARFRQIDDKLVAIGVERGDLLAKSSLSADQKQRLDVLEQDIQAGNVEFERFLADLARQFAAKPAAALHVEQLRETQGIMEDLRELPKGTVAIFTLTGEDKFRAILRTPDVQKAYQYPIKAADLNRKVLEFREAVQNPRADPRPVAQELYRILVGPMAKDLRAARAQTLMWSLDGVLRYVPLAALYDGEHYLIERYRVSVMTLASETRLKDTPDAKWRAAGFGVTKALADEPALTSVAGELSGIIAAKPGDTGVLAGEIKLDGEFTRDAMRQTLLKRYPVVHIASHFRFEPGNETQSFLLLGDGAHLSLAELKTSANLFGGVQLLTLSACNTGVGDGTEVEGFGTLAQRQGAKAVIATLWPVMDESTSILIQEFYRIRESSPGITKLEALRRAQLELLGGSRQGPSSANRGVAVHRERGVESSTPYSHPYYWAPFFLMGNWL